MTGIIDNDGAVTRPAADAADATVKLTATITKNEESDTKEFSLTVVSAAPAVNSVTINEGDQTKDPSASAFTLTAAVEVVGGADQAVEWSSDNAAVATVDAGSGEVTLQGVGTATITATSTFDTSKSATITLTVSAAPAVTSVTINEGDQTKDPSASAFTLTAAVEVVGGADQAVEWSSDNAAVATVDAGSGEVTLQGVGTAAITATSTFDTSKSATITLTVSAAPAVTSVTINEGDQTKDPSDSAFTLTAAVEVVGNAAQTVTWSSSDHTVATVAESGEVTLQAVGTAAITATSTFDTSKSATITLTVNPAPAVNSVTINEGDQTKDTSDSAFTLTAAVEVVGGADQAVTWNSSDLTVATVAESGEVTLKGVAGTAAITATSTFDTSKSATITLTVNPAPAVTSVTINEGDQTKDPSASAFTLTAAVEVVGNAAQTVTWSSSDLTVATVAESGEVTLKGVAGTAAITATSTFDTSKSATITLTVSTAPAVNSVTIDGGDQTKNLSDSAFTLTATVEVVGGADQAVTWNSSDLTVATVAESGEVTLKGVAGTAAITATSTFDTSKSATITLTVSALNSFSYTPAALSAEYGVETASGAPTWTPSAPAGTITYEIDPAVIGVTVEEGTGRVTIAANKSVTTADEPVTVKAMVDGAFYADATITVSVTAAALSGTLTYADKEISEGSDDTLSGSGTLLTGLTAGTDYTLSVTKSGAEVTAVTIDTASGVITIDNTIATGDAGTYTVKATGKGNYTGEVTTTFTLTVNAVTSVTINEGALTKKENSENFALTAAVIVVGGADQTVTWSSSDTAVAMVDAGSGEVTLQGVVGTAAITATSTFDASKSDSITLTVEALKQEKMFLTVDTGADPSTSIPDPGTGDYSTWVEGTEIALNPNVGAVVDSDTGGNTGLKTSGGTWVPPINEQKYTGLAIRGAVFEGGHYDTDGAGIALSYTFSEPVSVISTEIYTREISAPTRGEGWKIKLLDKDDNTLAESDQGPGTYTFPTKIEGVKRLQLYIFAMTDPQNIMQFNFINALIEF